MGKVAIRPEVIIIFIIQMTHNHYFAARLGRPKAK